MKSRLTVALIALAASCPSFAAPPANFDQRVEQLARLGLQVRLGLLGRPGRTVGRHGPGVGGGRLEAVDLAAGNRDTEQVLVDGIAAGRGCRRRR